MSFLKDFLFLNLSDYEKIGIEFPIGAIFLAFSAVMIGFVFYYNYYRSCASCLCLRLLRAGAISEEKGVGLKDLRLDSSLGVKLVLRGGGELRAVVKRVGEKKQSYEEYVKSSKEKGKRAESIDLNSARFYIDPDERERAERISGETHSIITPILISAAILLILVLAMLFLPDLLEILNK